MIKGLKLAFLLTIFLSCVGCDQVTKSAAKRLLTKSEPITLLNDFIIFDYTENPGGFLSWGADLPRSIRFLLFGVFAVVLLVAITVLSLKYSDIDRTQIVGIGLAVGGGLGNLLDRLVNDGRVIDFVSIGIGTLRTGIFNVADMAILAGVILLATGMSKEESVRWAKTTEDTI
jgi:signal peptidase II